MPVIHRIQHQAEDIEERGVTGLLCGLWSVDVILLLPINVPQFEKWISIVEGVPQFFEILFRVSNRHGSADLKLQPLGTRIGLCAVMKKIWIRIRLQKSGRIAPDHRVRWSAPTAVSS